jgi:hypothetical protein
MLSFQDTYFERTCIGMATYARRRNERTAVYRGTEIVNKSGSGRREKEEGDERGWNEGRNDFPSFFLNFVRLIDAPDRSGTSS